MSAPLELGISQRSDPFVAVLIARFEPQLDAQARQLQSSAAALENAQLMIQLLTERLRLERIAKYGKGSEKLSDLQLDLLDLEPGASNEEVQAESEREAISVPPAAPEDKTTQKRRSEHPGRQTLPAHLERVEKIVVCAPEQSICGGCGKETTVIGYEESEVLDVKPAEYFVTVIKREKRACKQCEEQGVAVAPVTERIGSVKSFV